MTNLIGVNASHLTNSCPFAKQPHVRTKKWTDSGQHIYDHVALSGLSAMPAIRSCPPVSTLRSVPSSASRHVAVWDTRPKPHSSVVQSQRTHRDELIKRSGRSICLSLVPTPAPCFWNAPATLWKHGNVSQAFKSPPEMYSWHFSCVHFSPVFYLGAKNLRKRIIMQMHGLWFLLMKTGPVQIGGQNAWLCA